MTYSLGMSIHEDGFASYPAYDNPYKGQTPEWVEWDGGYWDAHDMDYQDSQQAGIESGYGDFYDMDAVSQGFYDDDPSPYSGDYSEM